MEGSVSPVSKQKLLNQEEKSNGSVKEQALGANVRERLIRSSGGIRKFSCTSPIVQLLLIDFSEVWAGEFLSDLCPV